MKDLQIAFQSGRDVLNAYWGYLSDGGLIIPDQGLAVGEPVSLSVRIESSSASYSLAGKVVRCDSGAGMAVIAFSPGQPQDMLLTDALSDADKVPARRARRFRVHLEARVRDSRNGADPTEARLVDVSEYGCCFRLQDAASGAFAVGTPVEIAAPDFAVTGRVVWTRHTERGVAFFSDAGDTDAGQDLETVREFLRRLGS